MQLSFGRETCLAAAVFCWPWAKSLGDQQKMATLSATEKKKSGRKPPLPISDRQKLKPPQLCRLWGVDVETVLALIKSGQLKAINGALNPNGLRPRYLIDKRDIEAFEQARAVSGPAPQSPRRRRSAPGAKQYF